MRRFDQKVGRAKLIDGAKDELRIGGDAQLAADDRRHIRDGGSAIAKLPNARGRRIEAMGLVGLLIVNERFLSGNLHNEFFVPCTRHELEWGHE
ncbi:MAG: hypothetical protein WCL32_21535 [Planctomycetota bacterium]